MARNKIALNFYVDPKVVERLDHYVASQPLPPSKTAIIELAIMELLDRLEGKVMPSRKRGSR
jgi:hypothetical protein